MSAVESEPDIWCVTKANALVYHTNEECDYLTETTNYRRRSPRYVRHHDLEECKQCKAKRADQ